jgi:hypothetical protein
MRLENMFVTINRAPHYPAAHEFYANEKQTV